MKVELYDLERRVIDVCHEVGDFITSEGARFDRSRIEQKEGVNNLVS